MRATRAIALLATMVIGSTTATSGFANIVINEIVKEQLTHTAGTVADYREFIELYNGGSTAIDISGWTLNYYRLSGADVGTYSSIVDEINPGTILQPGQFYVLGNAANVPNVNQDLGAGELFQDLIATAVELRSGPRETAPIVDAIGYEVRLPTINGPAYAAGQAAQIGQGFHGRLVSTDVSAPNSIQSWGRWLNGRDTDNNGRDFGILPATPGTSNNLPQVPSHVVPDVSGLGTAAPVPEYFSSFIMPRAIDPTQLGPVGGDGNNINPRVLPAPPAHTGATKAIVAWDETGGGNTTWGRELVNKFDIYAYLDTKPLGVVGATGNSTEMTLYGIGTADHLFGTPDPTGTIFNNTSVLQNSSTGIGWMYQRREATNGSFIFSKLFLVDFGAGGNPRPDTVNAGTWKIIQELNIENLDADWYRLSIDYNPATGAVTAIFDDQVFTFTTVTDLLGTFTVGYRTAISNFSGNVAANDPPTFIQYVAPPSTGLDGDYNQDNVVDARDYVMWRKDTGAFGGNPTGYNTWRANFGAVAGVGAGFAAVPEPASLGLLVLGFLATALRREKR